MQVVVLFISLIFGKNGVIKMKFFFVKLCVFIIYIENYDLFVYNNIIDYNLRI